MFCFIKICYFMNKDKFCYITTPIFYPSGRPHIGHAFTVILGDFLKRFKVQRNYKVFLVTGTDEHGKKIAEKAKSNNLSCQEFVNKNSLIFKELFDKMQIVYDKFVRTTDLKHVEIVQKIFLKLQEQNYLYFDKWIGLYCTECEENYSESQVIKKDNENIFCPIGHKLIEIKESSYFVKISNFSKYIKNILLDNQLNIYPENRIKELINNFLNVGLKDLSITRESVSWGIPVPNHPEQTIYVWFDALFSYLTAIDYLCENDDIYQIFWNNQNCERIHLLSKEITRFHCIYWPILLNMLEQNLPSHFISHGWIVDKNGNKMSKSFNNTIDPYDWVNKYGNDAVRYYLLKEMSLDQDNKCDESLLINVYNADLANNLGNLVSRTIGMLTKYQNKKILMGKNYDEDELNMILEIKNLPMLWNDLINKKQFKKAFDSCLLIVTKINKLIEDKKPWELFKNNQIQKLNNILYLAASVIRFVFVILEPVFINKSWEVFKQMNFSNEVTTLESLKNFDAIVNIEVKNSIPLFVRINNKF